MEASRVWRIGWLSHSAGEFINFAWNFNWRLMAVATAENSPSATGFRGFFALGEQWLCFTATESDCDSLMLLNVGLILSWVIIFETRCVFRKKLSRFQVAPNVSQIFSSPCAQCQVVCSEKEPLILNISPLDLSRSHRLTPFCRISSAFNKSKVFFLLSFSFAFVSRTPTVHS